MIKINVPATSANVAVGFDSIGISLSLFNTYEVSENDSFELIGFNENFMEHNLVLFAYKEFARKYNKTPQPVLIKEVKQEIPIGKGLGSSAALLLSGVLAANEIHELNVSLYDCASFAATLEGHPDNVFAAAFGDLTAVFLENGKYHFDCFDISNDLSFTVLIPNTTGSTKTLRSVLPKDVALDDAIFSISRMIHLPKAFQEGDMSQLKRILKDRLHQPYRFEFIPNQEEVQALNDDLATVAVISGSGPSMLVLTTKSISFKQVLKDSFDIVPVSISKGCTVEVM